MTKQTKQRRAKKGGEYGVNGLWYNGGEFIANTELMPMVKGERKQGSGKREVEPYVWEVAPEDGKVAIYPYLSTFAKYDRNTKQFTEITAKPETIAYYKTNVFALSVLMQKFNRGERWM